MKPLFFVALLLWTIMGCTSHPVANFSYAIKPDGTVAFLNSSENAKIYQWKFGDGDFDNAKDPIHQFKKNGKYYVTLTVWNKGGTHSSVATLNINTIKEPSYIFWTKRTASLPIELYIDEVINSSVVTALKSYPKSCDTSGCVTIRAAPGLHTIKAIGADGNFWGPWKMEFKDTCVTWELR